MAIYVVPAILPRTKDQFEKDLATLTALPAVSRIQIDIVDGTFARPASWPYTAPAELAERLATGNVLPERPASPAGRDRIQYEMDLMCYHPYEAILSWFALGASRFTIHAGSVTDFADLFARLRRRYAEELESGRVVLGAALGLTTDLALIEPALGLVRYVQFMGIAEIGKQGQPFDRRVFEKVLRFRHRHPEIPIQVDGGISLDHAKELALRGVSGLVVGSAILGAHDPAAALKAFQDIAS